MEITRISSTEDFAALREEWDTLLSVSKADTVFLTWEWAFSWWETFHNADTSLFVLVVTEHGKAMGIAPLVLTRRRLGGLFAWKQITFLGAETAHGDYLDFIIDSHCDEREVLQAIFQHLEGHSAEWDFLCLTEIPERSVNLRHVAAMAADRGYGLVMPTTVRVCPFLVLPDTWQSLEPLLKKGLRKDVAYQKRRLARELGATFALHDEQNLEAELHTFWSLHEKRWSRKGQRGSFSDPGRRQFYRQIAQRCSETKWLRLCFLTVDQGRIASSFGLQYGNRYYDLQRGFDPAWSRYSVGSVLLAHVLEKAIADRCVEYDFLRGAEPYKYDWGAADKSTVGLRIANRHVRAQVWEAMLRLKRHISR